MEALFTPWRAAYLAGGGVEPGGCLFCELPKHDDAEALVVTRGRLVYAVLNRYPYTNGHVMLAPFAHRGGLAEMTPEERHELLDTAAAFETLLRETYRPHGFNAGLNLRRSAGAGVEHHAHLHIVPRRRNTNFMTVLGARARFWDLLTTRAGSRPFARFVTKRPGEPPSSPRRGGGSWGRPRRSRRAPRGAAFGTIVLLTAAMDSRFPAPETTSRRFAGIRPDVSDRRGHHAALLVIDCPSAPRRRG